MASEVSTFYEWLGGAGALSTLIARFYTVGLETGAAAADYIRLYDGDAAILTESFQFVQQSASAILEAFEPAQDGTPLCGWSKPVD